MNPHREGRENTRASDNTETSDIIQLPDPHLTGRISLEEALARRRSLRDFTSAQLTPAQLSQLLWAAHGITESRDKLRTIPSAGALYPLEIYLATADGLYHHLPHAHQLQRLTTVDIRPDLARAALRQTSLSTAPAVFVIAAVLARTAHTYGGDAVRYVHLEVGHAAQNILLQSAALGLGAVPIGAFYEQKIRIALGLPGDHEPLYLIPVGHPRDSTGPT